MDEFRIKSGIILPPPSLVKENESIAGAPGKVTKDFSSLLQEAINDINKLQIQADEAITKVQLDSATSIHEAMIALEKADISFRTMMQVRNKILDAYQEIMRMQV